MTTDTKLLSHISLQVKGMTCSNCALGVENYLKKEGMQQVSANFSTDEVMFETVEPAKVTEVMKGIEKLGYQVAVLDEHNPSYEGMSQAERFFYWTLPFTIPLLLHMFISWHVLHNPWVQCALATPVFILGLYHFGRSGWHSLKTGIPNMDVLIAMGATAAYGYSLYGAIAALGPDFLFFETAATIISLVLLGNTMEHRAVRQTTTAVQALMKLKDTSATRILLVNGEEVLEKIEAKDIEVGDLLHVNEGDAFPVDGEILWGEGTVDESMVTGESLPIEKGKGAAVIGGTLLVNGSVRICATAVGKATVLSQIIQLVKNAQANKPAIQQLADKVSAVFVPAVLTIALLTLGLSYWVFDLSLKAAIIHSVAVLVIACPCAMGLATPTAVVVGIGRASKKGILIKGGDTLEQFSKVKQVVFDKTGTLTTGEFQIDQLTCDPAEKEAVKSVLMAVEKHSSHPIAKSLVKALKGTIPARLMKVEEIKGKGMQAEDLEGNTYRIGSYALVKALTTDDQHSLYILKNDTLWATLDLSDELKPDAKAAIDALKAKGIQPILLSGDRQYKCDAVAKALGISEVYAEQLPAQKLAIIERLSSTLPTAMVGDGINDAPALAKATVGISLSGASEAALQSAQIVLLTGKLSALPTLFEVGHHTVLTIKQNLFWAFAYNIVAIPMAAMGFLTPMLGAAAMAFSDVIVIGNSLRLKVKKIID